MQLTNIQLTAVEKILDCYSSADKKRIDFKAPTGSGKTLMATHFISALIERYPEEKFVFVIATPSSSSLPFFFEQKINLYKKDLPYSKFEVEYIESPSTSRDDKTEATPKLLPQINKVFIFGKATFGKGRIFTERNIIEDFVQITEDNGYKLIYIRDEAHIGGNITNDQETIHFETLMQTHSDFVLNMTATPDYNSDTVKVIIRESDLNDARLNDNKWLIKTSIIPLLDRDISDEDLLTDAMRNFHKIKKEYQELEKNGVYIRPAMLIQVDNEPTNKERKILFNLGLQKLKDLLTSDGLAWVQYFGDNDKDSNRVYKGNFSLDDVTRIDNEIDVVIFKIGPSTGWDIPRACFLLQLRNVSSSTLNIQTIGRIKRNPYPNLEMNRITDKYYVYSNAPRVDDNVVIYSYNVKKNLLDDELAVIEITNRKNFNQKESYLKTKNDISAFLNQNKDNIIQNIKSLFVENEYGEDIYKKERIAANNHIVYSEIKNVFVLLKEIEMLKHRKPNIFNTYETVFIGFFKQQLKGQTIYKNIELLEDHMFLVLFKLYLQELDNIIRKNSPFTPEFRIELRKYEPKQYLQIFDGKVMESDTSRFDNYLFDIERNDNSKMNQPLDSKPEEIVFNELCLEIYRLDKLVKLWAKNIVTSNISGEYLDENQNFRNSYFDFIVKFSNGSFLYIEVKSENDIDPIKTELLEKAYAEYFSKMQISMFEYSLVIMIVKVSGNKITQKPFYDKNAFKKPLDSLSFKELLSEISGSS